MSPGDQQTQHQASSLSVDGRGGDPPAPLNPLAVVVIVVVMTVIGLAALPFVDWFPTGPPASEVELGAVTVGAADGPPLRAVAGAWTVRGSEVVVDAVTPLGFPAQYVADLGEVDGWLTVRAPAVSAGWGVVFRQRSAGDYLWVLAAPPFAALRVGRTDAGVPTDLGTASPVGVRDGMTLTVGFAGDTIRLLIDGREVARFTDVGEPPGTGVGLLGTEKAIGVATWSDFRAGVLTGSPSPGGGGG